LSSEYIIKKVSLSNFNKFKNIFPNISIFSEPLWISNVINTSSKTFGNKAFYLLAEKNKFPIAVMPICYRKIFGKKILLMPYFTPYFDISFAKTYKKTYKNNSIKKQIFGIFIDFLIKNGFIFGFFSINHDFIDFQPAIWRNILVYPRYTYIHKASDNILSSISGNLKNDIKFAKKNGISIKESENIMEFIPIWKKTLKRQEVSRIYEDVLLKLFESLKKTKKIKLFIAYDKNMKAISGCIIANDQKSSYYIAGADTREIRGSGSLGIVHAILDSIENGLDFDFEGSMIEGIEKYFRKFGGQLTPYFNMSSLSLQTLLKIKKILSIGY